MAIVSLILAAALAAQAGGGGAPAQAATPAAKPAQPEKVCVTEAQMGSHFKKRICATPDEWERRRVRDENEMSKMRDRAAACSGSAC